MYYLYILRNDWVEIFLLYVWDLLYDGDYSRSRSLDSAFVRFLFLLLILYSVSIVAFAFSFYLLLPAVFYL